MKKVFAILFGGHLIGACVTYFYFYVVFSGPREPQVPFNYEIGAFILGTGLLALSFLSLRRRSVALLAKIAAGEQTIEALDPETARFARREALRLPALTGLISFGVWLAAGGLFGFVEPLIEARLFGLDPPTLILSLRRFFGISFLGGGVTCLMVFFLVDMAWRSCIPRFFPEGHLGNVAFGFRMGLKTRFILIFSGMILIPIPVVGLILAFNINRLDTADALARAALIRSMYWEFAFVSLDFLMTSVILAYLLARSIISPLEEIQETVRAVEDKDLTRRVPVRSNDEIGDVAQGVNAMVAGLEQGEKARDSLGRYMCREIRDEVLARPPELSGEMKRVTLLFSDLRNFTGMVEAYHPDEVVGIINAYFDEMTRAVKSCKGLILQYVGDEIEAVFGAPVGFDEHPEMAVQAALAMRRGLEQLNKRFESRGLPRLSHGIGIHSGAVLAGNIGSQERMSYALVGDTVNTASRIEGLAKIHNTDIIVSQTTLSLLTGHYRTEPLSPVRVKGKQQEIIVYKLIS